MQYKKITDSRGTVYKLTYHGTAFHVETPDEVMNILENARITGQRLTLDYGNPQTGKSWQEINDITGYIGRSTGDIKIPLLVHNSRSIGGGAILDNCVIGIYTSKGKKPLYKLNIK